MCIVHITRAHFAAGVVAGTHGGKKACSSLEGQLTGLLHTCHRLCLMGCQAWLRPHLPLLWDTLFAAFEAFCQACHHLCTASCIISAQEEQQQQQQQQQTPLKERKPSSDHQQTVSDRIALFNALAKTGKAQDSVQQLHTAKGIADVNEVCDKGGSGMSGSCTLLTLLTKCTHMEGLLARLVPAFLAVLSFEGPQQVSTGQPLMILA